MTLINLLPWREERVKIKNRLFFLFLATALFTAILIILSTQLFFNRLLLREGKNIEILTVEQSTIHEEIAEIETLAQDKQTLLKRRDILESLQSDRFLMVRLFDILPKITPDGVCLTSIVRHGNQVLMSGVAESNTSISTLWRNMENTEWQGLFREIKLKEVTSDKKSKTKPRSRSKKKGKEAEGMSGVDVSVEGAALVFQFSFQLQKL